MSISNTFHTCEQIADVIGKGGRLYFSGICGVGMMSLAILFHRLGYDVCGYDRNPHNADRLSEEGIEFFPKCTGENVRCATAFVYTNAISDNAEDYVFAKKHGIYCISRANLLGYLTTFYKTSIAVSGVHGKSTVTSMIAHILKETGNNPTAVVGASAFNGSGLLIGKREYLTVEACEYMRSFLAIPASSSVITNIELEHTDCYKTPSEIEEAFAKFANCDRTEYVVVNADDNGTQNILPIIHNKTVRCSLYDDTVDFYAKNIECVDGSYHYDLYRRGEFIVSVALRLPGRHNVLNSIQALALCISEGISPMEATVAIGSFFGIGRRLEYMFDVGGAKVYNDYAHHPAEIRASLSALKDLGFSRTVCIFQPHTYSRTAYFIDAMADALSLADAVILLDIYAAREKNIYKVTSKDLKNRIGEKAEYASNFDSAAQMAMKFCDKDTVIVVMGAGDIEEIFSRIPR
ncbi:MAG: UDP-N-acetylmuramate--L-alanine ligase [Eubacteriales bacterium]|nr:UDP-N-acetylmuramate--L-alanine ligase [Eubacteriales bacterium]